MNYKLNKTFTNTKNKKMRTKPKTELPALNPKAIKVQLDYKTVITIPRMEALKAWLYRFPDAKVLAS